MFNLEQSITDWRRQMLAVGVATPTPLEELESHLREDVAVLQRSGLDEAEAFHTAVQNFGPAQIIQTEFNKTPAPADSLNWKFLRVLFAGFTVIFPLLISYLACVSQNGVFADLTPAQKFSDVAAAGFFSLLAWIVRLGHQRFPALQTSRSRVSGIALVMRFV